MQMSIKEAVIVGKITADSFYVINAGNKDTVFLGQPEAAVLVTQFFPDMQDHEFFRSN